MNPTIIVDRLEQHGPVSPRHVAVLNSYADLRNRALWAAQIDRDVAAARELAAECRLLLSQLTFEPIR